MKTKSLIPAASGGNNKQRRPRWWQCDNRTHTGTEVPPGDGVKLLGDSLRHFCEFEFPWNHNTFQDFLKSFLTPFCEMQLGIKAPAFFASWHFEHHHTEGGKQWNSCNTLVICKKNHCKHIFFLEGFANHDIQPSRRCLPFPKQCSTRLTENTPGAFPSRCVCWKKCSTGQCLGHLRIEF